MNQLPSFNDILEALKPKVPTVFVDPKDVGDVIMALREHPGVWIQFTEGELGDKLMTHWLISMSIMEPPNATTVVFGDVKEDGKRTYLARREPT